jgi:hypothetical protein
MEILYYSHIKNEDEMSDQIKGAATGLNSRVYFGFLY